MISLEHVGRRYGERVAVDDLSLEIGAGELLVLCGPSGCGKTTTLRMINRLIEPTSGVIRIDGRDTRERGVEELRRSIGYVIQQAGLFPHLSVAENIATVPRLLGWERGRIRGRVDELLELVGLPAAEYADRLPRALSGGERQRVGVARALGADPPVLLMDEPFSALDPITRLRLQGELLRVQARVRKTVMVVTHDIDEALRLGDRVALLRAGGRLAQVATPAELLAHPASDFVAGFLGGDRTLRRLALVPVSAAALRPHDGAPRERTVDAGGSLRDALEAVLRSVDGRAAVTEDGRVLGVVDAEAIRRAVADAG
ncbi:MAG TPA: ABC transporter ATP-binding protein [Candidatus Dormibacteraeota bacterium]|nr:ABC transporter ATP-binding protein [Candidatus Dormibacteraeota bacterium]